MASSDCLLCKCKEIANPPCESIEVGCLKKTFARVTKVNLKEVDQPEVFCRICTQILRDLKIAYEFYDASKQAKHELEVKIRERYHNNKEIGSRSDSSLEDLRCLKNIKESAAENLLTMCTGSTMPGPLLNGAISPEESNFPLSASDRVKSVDNETEPKSTYFQTENSFANHENTECVSHLEVDLYSPKVDYINCPNEGQSCDALLQETKSLKAVLKSSLKRSQSELTKQQYKRNSNNWLHLTSMSDEELHALTMRNTDHNSGTRITRSTVKTKQAEGNKRHSENDRVSFNKVYALWTDKNGNKFLFDEEIKFQKDSLSSSDNEEDTGAEYLSIQKTQMETVNVNHNSDSVIEYIDGDLTGNISESAMMGSDSVPNIPPVEPESGKYSPVSENIRKRRKNKTRIRRTLSKTCFRSKHGTFKTKRHSHKILPNITNSNESNVATLEMDTDDYSHQPSCSECRNNYYPVPSQQIGFEYFIIGDKEWTIVS